MPLGFEIKDTDRIDARTCEPFVCLTYENVVHRRDGKHRHTSDTARQIIEQATNDWIDAMIVRYERMAAV